MIFFANFISEYTKSLIECKTQNLLDLIVKKSEVVLPVAF